MTTYQAVNDVFLGKITDIDLVSLPSNIAESTLKSYMVSAIARFTQCRKDLTDRDDTLKQFNTILTDLEIEVTATWMKHAWIDPFINNIMLMKQNLSSSDFKTFSQANHLKELTDLKIQIEEEVSSLLGLYSYNNIFNTFNSI
jgi:hypothetical protein